MCCANICAGKTLIHIKMTSTQSSVCPAKISFRSKGQGPARWINVRCLLPPGSLELCLPIRYVWMSSFSWRSWPIQWLYRTQCSSKQMTTFRCISSDLLVIFCSGDSLGLGQENRKHQLEYGTRRLPTPTSKHRRPPSSYVHEVELRWSLCMGAGYGHGFPCSSSPGLSA